jgi:hypothetical protein
VVESAHNDADLARVRSGRVVALHARVQRRIAGWQLPYLRVALILRRLHHESFDGVETYLIQKEIANVERVHGEVRRAGWFN